MTSTPATLGAYPIERELGRGGMGVVYLARDPRLQREVAIKVLPDLFATDPERLARFEREARLLASLKHPNIAVIHGLEEAAGQRFLVLEYIEGDTLAQRIARGALPVGEALDVSRQIAAAVEAAHEGGVIHRDLKPGNVKITPAGDVRVLDFGLAKGEAGAVTAASGDDLSHSPTLAYTPTGVGVILGTAAYMSPEQARGKSVDKRTDIWSFGCILYECLTGRQAFAGETVSDTIAKILERDPEWSALPAQTPGGVRHLLERCLEKDPKKRLRDIGDARIELEQTLASRTESGRIPVAATPSRPGAGRALGIALAAGVAVGAVAALVAWNSIGPGARAREKARVLDQVSHLSVRLPSDMRFDAAILSPDGAALVCSGRARESGGSSASSSRLYVRRLDGYELKELPGTVGVLGGAPSEDGRSVVLLAPASPGATRNRIYRAPIDGSSPPLPLTDWKDEWTSLVTLANGDIVVLVDQGASFQRIPASGGDPSPPKKIDAGDFRGTLAMRRALPGDHAVLVNGIGYGARGWFYQAGVLDLDKGRVRFVIDDAGNPVYLPTGHLLFTRGEVLMAVPFDLGALKVSGAPVTLLSGLRTRFNVEPAQFWIGANGTLVYQPGGAFRNDRRLAFLDASGNARPWSDERRPFGSPPPSVTRDGRRFAIVITNAQGIDEIWMSDVDRPALRRVIAIPDADCDLGAISPDGQWIAFYRSGRDSSDGTYIQRSDGQGQARRVYRPPTPDAIGVPTGWTPDGASLLMFTVVSGISHAVLLPSVLDPSRHGEPVPVVGGFHDETVPALSPDGRLLAFQSGESGRSETYVGVFHEDGRVSDPIRVSTDGAQLSGWVANGRSLLYLDLGNHVMEVPIETAPALSAGPPVPRFDAAQQRIVSMVPLPDGRFLGVVGSEIESGEVTNLNVVLDYFDEIRRKTRGAR